MSLVDELTTKMNYVDQVNNELSQLLNCDVDQLPIIYKLNDYTHLLRKNHYQVLDVPETIASLQGARGDLVLVDVIDCMIFAVLDELFQNAPVQWSEFVDVDTEYLAHPVRFGSLAKSVDLGAKYPEVYDEVITFMEMF